MRRRDLLRWAALAGVLPAWSPRANTAIPPAPAAGTARCLVLVELKGGNDGLNTLVPFTDPAYDRVRPRLAIARDRVLALDDRTGLHPALRPLMPAREAGELARVRGIGYAEPNRSHFRSMDIRETASDRDAVLETGWIARAGPGPATGALPDAVILGGDEGPARGGGLQVTGAGDELFRVRPAGGGERELGNRPRDGSAASGAGWAGQGWVVRRSA